MSRHIISVLVENEAGALSRIAGLFSARGYNIESLTVGRTSEPGISRMTIVMDSDQVDADRVMASPIDHWHGLLEHEAAGPLCARLTGRMRERRLRFGVRALEPARQRSRILAVALHAQGERLQPSSQEERGECVQDGARVDHPAPGAADERRAVAARNFLWFK